MFVFTPHLFTLAVTISFVLLASLFYPSRIVISLWKNKADPGKESVDSIHKKLGHIMWEYVGMGRTAEGLKKGIAELKAVRKEFETNLFIPGSKEGMNVELDKAIRLYDFITMGELVAYDALNRNESCGGHFREEYQTEEGEAKRDDENFFYVACWEYQGDDEKAPVLYKEDVYKRQQS